MRAPDDLPRRAPRRKNGRRGRTLLIVGVIAAFILLTSLRGIAGFYTDYLWFDSLDQSGVWRGILGAKLSLALIFMVGFFLLAWANLLIADRIAPPFRLAGPEDELCPQRRRRSTSPSPRSWWGASPARSGSGS